MGSTKYGIPDSDATANQAENGLVPSSGRPIGQVLCVNTCIKALNSAQSVIFRPSKMKTTVLRLFGEYDIKYRTLPMKQIWILALISLFVITGCKSKVEQVENIDSYGYTERYQRNKADFAKQGLYQKLDDQGRLMEEASYENDTLSGIRVLYFENGDTQIVETYREGIFDGPYRSYYESGQLNLTGHYQTNEMTGDWDRYYKNGQLMERVRFEKNAENGPFIEYYENGNLKAEGTYLNGDNEHGLLKLYDEQGELKRKMNCESGICRTTWKREGEE